MERERISVSLSPEIREELLSYAKKNGLKEATAATVLLTRAVAQIRSGPQRDATNGGERRQTR